MAHDFALLSPGALSCWFGILILSLQLSYLHKCYELGGRKMLEKRINYAASHPAAVNHGCL